MACAELEKLKNPPEALNSSNGPGVAGSSSVEESDAKLAAAGGAGGAGDSMELDELDPAQELAVAETDKALDKAPLFPRPI